MAIIITTTKDAGSSRVFLRRRTAAVTTKLLEPVIRREDKLDCLPTGREITRA